MFWLLAFLVAAPPDVTYTIRVDPADLTGFDVTVHVRHAPPSFGLAMYRHPEYDDRYWRYFENVTVDGATITPADSGLWQVTGAASDVTVHYRLRLPPERGSQRGAWKPFLTPTGGLVDGPHALLYVVGAERAPSRVRLSIPEGWRVATSLATTMDSTQFYAATVGDLMDGPMLMGRFHDWRFTVDDTPHRVVYWDGPDAKSFDTLTFVSHVAAVVQQAVALFRRPPYAQFSFLFQDGAYGALEHPDAVTIGAPSTDLAADPDALLEETAHEYFHAWNLMRIRPAGYGGVTYRPRPLSTGLWVSEGFTMFYADLLARRAGLRLRDSTRESHLERLLNRYLENPAFARFSAERVSQASYATTPLFLGDYQGSTHLQGEVLGTMLDLLIRSRSAGQRSLDDVMRGLAGDSAGFTTRSVQDLVGRACRCDAGPFFDQYVRGARQVDVNRYLSLIGLRAQVDWVDAVNDRGRPIPDGRVWSYQPQGAARPLLLLNTPASQWGRAGLHSGDTLVSVSDSAMDGVQAFRRVLMRLRVGDTLRVVVRRAGGEFTARVPITGFRHPVVRLVPIAGASEQTGQLRSEWEMGH
ncbi:MAG TPA: hypothetical protein VNX15_01125 [Gemmatimonadales bacterium]|jgi:predicted metalloprotease with PDZ domain|nr:hypothetical protein [Gemmatimonadales bacterium]